MASSPRNRRPPASSRGRPAPPSQPSEEEIGEPAPLPLEDDVSVEMPEGTGSFEEETAPADAEYVEDDQRSSSSANTQNTKSRKRSRNSRRVSSISDRRSSRNSGMSPEERAARRSALMAAIKLAGGLIILVGGFYLLWWGVLRDDPKVAEGKNKINDVTTSLMTTIDQNLDDHRPQDAEATLALAHQELDDVTKLDKPELNVLVANVKSELADREDRLVTIKHDNLVQTNLGTLLDQFQHISDEETDLDKLQTAAQAFMDDPVDYPAGVKNTAYIQQYAAEVNRIQVKMAEIDSERNRRKVADTQTPVDQTQKIVKNLTSDGKFQEALTNIDDAARKFPAADFSGLRSWVNDDAKKSWETTKSEVDNLYEDYEAIGSSAETRKDALDKARTILHAYIDNCGISDYVDQAKQLLAKYPE